eukprot:3016083-Pleurochrysis_carterae.AAC.1
MQAAAPRPFLPPSRLPLPLSFGLRSPRRRIRLGAAANPTFFRLRILPFVSSLFAMPHSALTPSSRTFLAFFRGLLFLCSSRLKLLRKCRISRSVLCSRLRIFSQEAVRAQQRKWADNIDDGDVFVSNHPQLAGEKQ